EIARDARDPLTGRSIGSLLANLDRRPSYVAFNLATASAGELFEQVASALSAVAICGAPSIGDPLERPRRAPDRTGWRPEACGDRWILSDFWFDAAFLAAESQALGFGERFHAARTEVIVPTFVVSGPGGRRALAHQSPAWRGEPEMGDVPILEVESSEPD